MRRAGYSSMYWCNSSREVSSRVAGRARTASPRRRERSSSGLPRQGPARPCRTGTAGSRGRRPARSPPRSPRPRERTSPVREVAGDVREPVCKSLEDVLVELLAGTDDRPRARVRRVARRSSRRRRRRRSGSRAARALEPVQRAERHHLREITRDPEDDEHIGRPRFTTRLRDACPWSLCRAHASTSLCVVEADAPVGHAARSCPFLALLIRVDADPAHALVCELAPGPVDDGLRTVLVRREERQVHCPPGELRFAPLHRLSTEHLHYCGVAPDRGHRALVVVRKGFSDLPATRRETVSPACSPDWSATEPS